MFVEKQSYKDEFLWWAAHNWSWLCTAIYDFAENADKVRLFEELCKMNTFDNSDSLFCKKQEL